MIHFQLNMYLWFIRAVAGFSISQLLTSVRIYSIEWELWWPFARGPACRSCPCTLVRICRCAQAERWTAGSPGVRCSASQRSSCSWRLSVSIVLQPLSVMVVLLNVSFLPVWGWFDSSSLCFHVHLSDEYLLWWHYLKSYLLFKKCLHMVLPSFLLDVYHFLADLIQIYV
jgi:hypothetical protein